MDMFLAPIIIGVTLIVICIISIFRASQFDFRCTRCKKVFKENPVVAAFAPQSGGRKYLRCPNCRRKMLCDLILKGKK